MEFKEANMWLIIAIAGINFALIGRVKEFRDENFIVFKRISLLITALCLSLIHI